MVKIELSNCGTVFFDTELKNLKSKNFFYGKNGTGKSTLCELIRDQTDKDFDVRVFQGFESVLGEDKRLNAIVLGEENKKIQEQVDGKLEAIQKNYVTMRKKQDALDSLFAGVGVEKNQILLSYEKAKDDLENQEQQIGSFYQKAASELTIQFNLGRSYNRNNFKEDIPNSKKLSSEEQKKLLQILSENEKPKVLEKGFPSINFEAYLKSTNELLQKKVEAKTVIPELENNSKKRAFAEKGLELHCENDRCAFCGGEVTESRITELETYFKADEVIKLQSRVNDGINKITIAISELEEINLLDKSQFYSQFDVNDMNQQLKDRKMEQINFLAGCTSQLEEKKKNLFESINLLQKDIPEDFFAIQKDINDLIKKNNDFTQNIEQNKRTAKKRLKLNSVAEKCEISNYERLQGGKATLEHVRNDAKKILESEIEKVSKDKKEIEELIEAENLEIQKLQEKIKNPKIITQTINDKLSKSGKHNLKLKYIEPEKHYQILNSDGSTRDINEISTGEKNIISFLYFLGSLSSPDLDKGKPKLIILDDPMNSNDDTMQYLIISEIEKLYNAC